MILGLVRNYIPSYNWVIKNGWNIADCVSRSYDVEGMNVGTVAAGRIGLAVLKRMKPFDVKLHYFDKHRLPEETEKELGLTFHQSVEEMVKVCDIITINAPLHPETENLFDEELISKMKHGAYLVNTARGKICDRNACCKSTRDRTASRVCRKRLVSTTPTKRSSLENNAKSRHDTSHFWNITFCPDKICIRG